MDDQFTRLRWVAGNESIDIMKTKHVAVFGCGGVGGYVIEGLVRSGIGTIDVFVMIQWISQISIDRSLPYILQ